jgi:hypothetical protein
MIGVEYFYAASKNTTYIFLHHIIMFNIFNICNFKFYFSGIPYMFPIVHIM